MARILVVDDEKVRHTRFHDIFSNIPVEGEARQEEAFPKLVHYRWVGNRIVLNIVDHAYSPMEAMELLEIFTYDLICLDHDMRTRLDGRDLCNWMVTENVKFKNVLIHSQNPIAAAEMAAILRDHKPYSNIKLLPFKPKPQDQA